MIEPGCAPKPFSPREREIVELLVSGHSTLAIAGQLHLTLSTVKSYIKTIYCKAEVHSARQLIVKLMQQDGANDPRCAAFTRIAAATTVVDIHAATLAALRAWTRARRAFYWELKGDGLHPLARMSCAAKYPAIPASGITVLSAASVERDRFLQAAAYPRTLTGEVLIGVLKLGDRSWLIALGDALGGAFDPEAAKIMAVLLHVAQCQAGALTRSAPGRVTPASAKASREAV